MNIFSKNNPRATANKGFCAVLAGTVVFFSALGLLIKNAEKHKQATMDTFAQQPAATAIWARTGHYGLEVGFDTTGDSVANYFGFKKSPLITTNELGKTQPGAIWLKELTGVKQY